MKNKKLAIGSIAIIALLGGGYYAKNTIEQKVELEIQQSLADANIQYELIDYDVLKNRLELKKLYSKDSVNSETYTFSIDRILLHDFNRTLFSEEKELPDVFGALLAENLSFNYENSQSDEKIALSLSEIDIKEYKQNIPKLIEEAEIDDTSVEFYKTLLNFAHNGMNFDEFKVSYTQNSQDILLTQIDSYSISQNKQNTMSDYLINNFSTVVDEFNLKVNKLELKELVYPSIENTAQLLNLISSSAFTYEDIINNFPELLDNAFTYKNIKPFDLFAITALNFTSYEQGNKGMDISLASTEVQLDYDESDKKAKVETKVNDFTYKSDFTELNSFTLKKIFDVFEFNTLQFSSKNTMEIDLNSKQVISTSKSNFPKLSEIEFSADMRYLGDEFWLFALTGSPDFKAFSSGSYSTYLQDIEYKSIDIQIKDQGLIPMVVAYNALESSLSMEQSKNEIIELLQGLNAFTQMGTQGLKKISNELTAALVEQIESPDELSFSLSLGDYYDFDAFVSSLLFSNSIKLDYLIKSSKGKSVLESIPSDLNTL